MHLDFNSCFNQLLAGATMGIIASPGVASASEVMATLPEVVVEQDVEVHVCKCVNKKLRTVRLIRSPKTKRLMG